MAKTHIIDRSTYWFTSDGPKENNIPYPDGDHRCYWSIYYEQTNEDRKPENNRSKVIVDYYVQTHKQKSVYADVLSYGGTDSVVTIKKGSSTEGTSYTISTGDGNIVIGDNYSLRYIGSHTWYISHNTDGTGSFKFSGKGFGMGTKETTYSLPKINRYTLLGDVPEFNIDTGITFNLTKYVSSFYDKLEILYGSTVIKTVTNITKDYAINSATSTKVTFTETELNNIYKLIPTGTNATFTFKLTTYSDSGYKNVVGSQSKTVTGNFTTILPTFSTFDYYDNNSKSIAATGSNKTIVALISDVYVTISSSQLAKANTRQASISHYIINGVKVNSTGNAITYKLGKVESDGISIQAVDTRGTASIVVSKKFTKYISYKWIDFPLDNVHVLRSDNDTGPYVDVEISGTWWNGNFGKVQNQLTFSCVYYQMNASSYVEKTANTSNITMTKNGNSVTISGRMYADNDTGEFDINSTYWLEFRFQDSVMPYYGYISGDLSPGQPAIAFYKNKVSLGDKYDESLGGTQLWGDIYVNGEKYVVDGEKYVPDVVVYNNDSGSNASNITFNRNITGCEYIEIFYYNNAYDNAYSSVKVYNPIDKSINMQTIRPLAEDNKMYVIGAIYSCSSTGLNRQRGYGLAISPTSVYGVASDTISITKVVCKIKEE